LKRPPMMSALPPKADMVEHCDVRFVPKADIRLSYSIPRQQ